MTRQHQAFKAIGVDGCAVVSGTHEVVILSKDDDAIVGIESGSRIREGVRVAIHHHTVEIIAGAVIIQGVEGGIDFEPGMVAAGAIAGQGGVHIYPTADFDAVIGAVADRIPCEGDTIDALDMDAVQAKAMRCVPGSIGTDDIRADGVCDALGGADRVAR